MFVARDSELTVLRSSISGNCAGPTDSLAGRAEGWLARLRRLTDELAGGGDDASAVERLARTLRQSFALAPGRRAPVRCELTLDGGQR
jgi:hypothetical protein